MTDIDKLLSDSLKETGGAFAVSDVATAQERFMKRRRRRFFLQAGAGVAVAAAAAIAIVALWPQAQTFQKDRTEEPIRPATGLEVDATISVGKGPTSLVATGDSVWVSNTQEGTVVRLNESDQVVDTIEIDGRPDEIVTAGDFIFVSDAESGEMYEIDPSSLHVTPFQVVEGGARFDLSVYGSVIVALDMDTGDIHLIGGDPSTITCPNKPECHFSDVAADDNESWALNGATGELMPIDIKAGTYSGRKEPQAIPNYEGSSSADLALGYERFWVTDGNGHLWVTDPKTGEWSSHDIGFDIGDISIGENAVYLAASDNESTDGALLKIDPDSGEVVEELLLSGNPVDATTSGSAVWVAQQSANTVSRVGAAGDREELLEQVEDAREQAAAEIVLVYSAQGDIRAAMSDGTKRILSGQSALEYNPTISPDVSTVVFESWDQESRDPDIVRLDLSTRETEVLGKGRSPDFDGAGGLAYVDADGKIVYERKLAKSSGEFTDPDGAVGQIRWAAGGRFIFYMAALGHEPTPELRDVDTAGEFEGATYQAPEAESWFVAPSELGPNSVGVLSLCCNNDPIPTQAELGEFDSTNPGAPNYRGFAELDGKGFDPAGNNLFTVSSGTLTVRPQDDGSVLWNQGDLRTWIVGDGNAAFLVNESGDVYRFEFDVEGGMDVNPSFRP